MVFNYVFLLENYQPDFFNSVYENPIEFIIPVNEEIIGLKPALFKDLHNSKNRFCFCFGTELTKHNSKFLKEEIIRNLVRMLFLPNYIRVQGAYLFFVEKAAEGDKKFGLLKAEIQRELKKQGLDELIFETISDEVAHKNDSSENLISVKHSGLNNYLKNENGGSNFEVLIKNFDILAYLKTRLIITVQALRELNSDLKLIQEFENWFMVSKPVKVKLVEMFSRAEMESHDLKIENQLLKAKLKNSMVYLTELKKNSQWYINDHSRLTLEIQRFPNNNLISQPALPVADNQGYIMQLQSQIITHQNHANEILEWYKKEYEVLPMWYKRFGQIIKVFMGKRTFKSLFK